MPTLYPLMVLGYGANKVNKDVLYSAVPFITGRGGQITVEKKITIGVMFSRLQTLLSDTC